ncbi:DNA adenine methylase [Aeromonas hydrophila]|uniref:DNA-methyltransferase n=1 Tax=Aeromonas hydrophila TaxID=644 RepID=UPI0005374D27|nr:site-specific DNA-methyltransferase [Aeromonas hydrophila]KHA57135.1 DNA adenine methylase [Aeromonas hydrophila]
MIPTITLICNDAIAVADSLPAHSVDLLIVDPPYYKVKADAWDHQWPSEAAYLAWLEACMVAFTRVLKPTGSLYLFCGSRLAADTELMVRRHTQLLNHIVWAKPCGRWNGCNAESLRSYFPATERILFAEPKGADGSAVARSGYRHACHSLRRQTFSPLIDYFRAAKEAAGISAAEINAATGTHMAGHWFGASQWQLPNREQYAVLQQLFASKQTPLRDFETLTNDYQGLSNTYNQLKESYDDLREQFDKLRRPFFVTKATPYTDVWTYPPVQFYPGKHPCEKPASMLEHMIQASSREGDVVADFFAGSGSTAKAAWRLGRHFVGAELDADRYEKTRDELDALQLEEKPDLDPLPA